MTSKEIWANEPFSEKVKNKMYLCNKTFSMSFSANFGSLSISNSLALSNQKYELVSHQEERAALPDLEALEDVEVAVVLVGQLLVSLQSQESLSMEHFLG